MDKMDAIGEMDVVKAFNAELSSLYETKPPISKAKMTSITRTAIKAIKYYKHVVQSVEKFIMKCKPEYKVPGLYVIDSIVRQSRHQYTPEKDVFAPRFARNIQNTFLHLFNCSADEKGKIVRVLNLWQKNHVFTTEQIQPLLDMASLANKDQLLSSNGVQPSSNSINRTPSKQSPVKEPSWLSDTPSAVPPPQKMDSNIAHQFQNLQNALDKDGPNQLSKKDEVKFDNLIDSESDDDEEPLSPQQQPAPQSGGLPSIDSLQSILSNPEVLRHLQNLQQQMSSRKQQQELEDKMRRLQEMRHQEEEFDKHLAQTLPNLPFAAECDFKPTSSIPQQDLMSVSSMHQIMQPPQPTSNTQPVFTTTTPHQMLQSYNKIQEADSSSMDYDERNRMSRGRGGNGGNDRNSSMVGDMEIIDLISGGDSCGTRSPQHSSRGRSGSRDRGRKRDRRSSSPRRGSSRRSRSRSRRRRSRSRDRDDRDKERRRRGLPPVKKNHLAVCSTTLWVGHLSKLVQEEELSDTFGEYGDVVSINLIPPRGCAFVCMNRRQDAAKALQHLKHTKLQGKAITLAWAPGKGMKDKEWKDYWEVENGVSYIPWTKLSTDTDLTLLEEGALLDEETFPDWMRKNNIDLPVLDDSDIEETLNEKKYEEQAKRDQDQRMFPQQNNLLRTDMEISNQQPPPPMSQNAPSFMPLNDSQPGPGPMPPPLGLMPPFGIPPRMLGPSMGPPMPLSLGVPPPMMMPPQGLRLPQSFNQDLAASMVNPFGLPLTALTGIGISQAKGSSEMDIDESEEVGHHSKENNPQHNLMNMMSNQSSPFMPMQMPPPAQPNLSGRNKPEESGGNDRRIDKRNSPGDRKRGGASGIRNDRDDRHDRDDDKKKRRESPIRMDRRGGRGNRRGNEWNRNSKWGQDHRDERPPERRNDSPYRDGPPPFHDNGERQPLLPIPHHDQHFQPGRPGFSQRFEGPEREEMEFHGGDSYHGGGSDFHPEYNDDFHPDYRGDYHGDFHHNDFPPGPDFPPPRGFPFPRGRPPMNMHNPRPPMRSPNGPPIFGRGGPPMMMRGPRPLGGFMGPRFPPGEMRGRGRGGRFPGPNRRREDHQGPPPSQPPNQQNFEPKPRPNREERKSRWSSAPDPPPPPQEQENKKSESTEVQQIDQPVAEVNEPKEHEVIETPETTEQPDAQE